MKRMTKTRKRIEFLRRCLENGMPRNEAAKELTKQDKNISLAYARTLVYTFFSGDDYTPTYKVPKLNEITDEDGADLL